MALFDSLINEVGERFGIGDKAGTLLSALLSLITGSETGGIAGFLNMFKTAGLGDLASSWISSGANSAISNEQLESAVGTSVLSRIADKVGLPTGITTSALGFMIPQVIDKLSPNGEIPENDSIMSTIGGYLTGAGAAVLGAVGATAAVASGAVGAGIDTASDAAKAVGAGVSNAANTVGSGVSNAANTVGAGVTGAGKAVGAGVSGAANFVGDKFDDVSSGGGGGMLKWILPLLLLGLLLFLGYQFCGNKKPEVATTNTNKTVSNANTGAVKAIDGSFKIEAKDGKYNISGVVGTEAEKKQIVDALTAQYGAGNVNFDGLKVEAGAKLGSGWWDNFTKLLPNLKDWKTGTLAFAGAAITQAVGLPTAAIDSIKSLFGTGWTLPMSIIGEAGAAKAANEDAEKKLEELAKADNVSVDEVVKTLNATIINFASGKSDVPADAKNLIEDAAAVMKKMKEGSVIEVGGHTDNKGNAAGNLKLSQSRAESVRKALIAAGVGDKMLTAKGYGDTKAIGDNATPEGQFKNRRIEYKTADGTAPTVTTTTTTNTNAAKPANTNK